MATDATILSLHAAGGLGQIIVTALATAPAGMACLPYMQPASIRIYEATTNNFASAALVGTISSATGVFVRDGLGASVTRYYWAAALDSDGNEGARYPAGGGAAATTLTATPEPNSIGPSQLQNNAVETRHYANLSITDAKIASLNATKITASFLSAISANLGTVTAGSVTGVTITGGEVRTAASGNRVVMDGLSNTLSIFAGASQIFRAGPSPDATWEGVISVRASASLGLMVLGTPTGLPAARIMKGTNGAGLIATAAGYSSGSSAVIGTNAGAGHLGLASGDGSYGVYAAQGGVGPFTGAHDAMILKDDPAQPGDIVFDRRVIQRSGWGDTLTEVGQADEVGQRGVVGVIDVRMPFDPMSMLAAHDAPRDHRTDRQIVHNSRPGPQPGIVRRRWAEKYDRLKINSVGEGQMSVCGRGGDLELGDLICASDLAGKGQRQADDIVRSWTVAKTREDVTFDYPDQVKIVAVIYLCG